MAYTPKGQLRDSEHRKVQGTFERNLYSKSPSSEGGYFHDNLRVLPRHRQEQDHTERRCACGKRLSTYNRTDLCYACGGGR